MNTRKSDNFYNAEAQVKNFYNELGWKSSGDSNFNDAVLYEDLRNCAIQYVNKCRLKLLDYIPKKGNSMLDMASGPIQYQEYLKYSENFNHRYCVDLSKDALDSAQIKIGEKGKFFLGSFFDIDFEENFFDCSISLHTIYHMHKNSQAKAIKKLIKVTKNNAPIIIIYENPYSIDRLITSPIKLFKLFLTLGNFFSFKKYKKPYFWAHSIRWWNQFEGSCRLNIVPWRSFSSQIQKIFFPDNILGVKMFKYLWFLENKFPNFFKYLARYNMIILYKK